ncbi:MAG: hypothetical protein ABIJ95_08650, partial [Pseudomonadota bacterium]
MMHSLFSSRKTSRSTETINTRSRKTLGRLFLILAGIFVAAFLVEIACRPFSPYFFSAKSEPDHYTSDYDRKQYRFDDELGYRPCMGKGCEYNSTGTKNNEYDIEKNQETIRVLFLGDSITAIGYT